MTSAKHDRHHIAIRYSDLDKLPTVIVSIYHGTQVSNSSTNISTTLGPVDGLNPVIHELLFAIDRDFNVDGLVFPKGRDVNADFVHDWLGATGRKERRRIKKASDSVVGKPF